MRINKDLDTILKDKNLEKTSSVELLVLANKIKIIHENIKNQILDKLDEEEYIVNRYVELMSVIENRK